ncbi:MAG: hypothetical protein OEZ04_00950 [Nitrospinota bacterium]|nr:hypothetical protein [Nitrospinota bacterium]
MPRLGLAILSLFSALGLFSCVTFEFPPHVATGDLASMARPGYPTFRGLGELTMESLRGKFTGAILLALDGEQFRVEISDRTGRTVRTWAWNGTRLMRLNLSTGAKEWVDEGFLNKAPMSLGRTMVTGAPPGYTMVTSTKVSGRMKVAWVAGPDMGLFYQDNRLAKVEGVGALSWELVLGPFKKGPMAPYVESAALSAVGTSLSIRWIRVEQGVRFAPGFFMFEEDILGPEQW